MASSVDESDAGAPLATSSTLTMASKHLAIRCRSENIEFLKCKRKDPNPEKCLHRGREVTRCFFGVLKDLQQKCTKEFDTYSGCLYYHTNEFEMCRKEQAEFEKACPLE